MKKTFTKQGMIYNKGCYSLEELQNCSFMKEETITIEEIVNSEIPLKDKYWFTINKCDITTRQKQDIAISVAEIVLVIYETKQPNNKAPREAIQAAKDYLAGLIDRDTLLEKRRAAADAADAAAYAAYAADAADDAADAAYAAAYAADAAAAAYAAAAAADAAD